MVVCCVVARFDGLQPVIRLFIIIAGFIGLLRLDWIYMDLFELIRNFYANKITKESQSSSSSSSNKARFIISIIEHNIHAIRIWGHRGFSCIRRVLSGTSVDCSVKMFAPEFWGNSACVLGAAPPPRSRIYFWWSTRPTANVSRARFRPENCLCVDDVVVQHISTS